jgi:nicotinate-nucleotide adenylyltransferase
LSHPHKHPARPRSIALFGGSFDPVHVGHMAVARAAQRRFHLDKIHFIPSGLPPHKPNHHLAPFPARYAMVALACAEHPSYVASLVEAGADSSGLHTFYSIDTVRRFRRELRASDRLYFIIGVDAFLHIPTWRNYETLLDSCDFIVASRPGFKLEALRLLIPPELLARDPGDRHTIALRRTRVHLLDTVRSHVSATEIRERCRHHKPIHGLVPVRVEEYILKQALYS